jgi:hypothetical protein
VRRCYRRYDCSRCQLTSRQRDRALVTRSSSSLHGRGVRGYLRSLTGHTRVTYTAWMCDRTRCRECARLGLGGCCYPRARPSTASSLGADEKEQKMWSHKDERYTAETGSGSSLSRVQTGVLSDVTGIMIDLATCTEGLGTGTSCKAILHGSTATDVVVWPFSSHTPSPTWDLR